MRRPRRTVALLACGYVLLLAASDVVRFAAPPRGGPGPGASAMAVRAVDGDHLGDRRIRLVYEDHVPEGMADPSAVLLLHGTPGRRQDLEAVGAALSRRFRVVIPDLPGFGQSTHEIPDYSMLAHARYLVQLLDGLGIRRVDVVGFSFGGGVALELYRIAPRRIRSVTLLSATGVQELELLGDYHVNHALHGMQLALLWAAREGLPHFGLLDRTMLSVAYARNLYDTDQRPLRAILREFQPPMLIIHGTRDPLVPVAAALEHHRLVPQSELVLLDASHFMPFTHGREIGDIIGGFLERVGAGEAVTRAQADPARVAEAARPFDASTIPPASGFTLALIVVLIAAATFVSEDLTCIAVGLMVGRGAIGFVPGTLACFAGIYAGDLSLYAVGRFLGRPAVRWAPLRWMIRPETLEASSRWFSRRGPVVIGISRFLPGTRLPTYLAAGVLRTGFASFSLWFLVAAAVWTPLLVGFAALIGAPSLELFERFAGRAVPAAVVVAAVLLVAARVGVRAATHRGRRLLLSRWRRLTRWEFWPLWLFYPPVVAYILYLGARWRGPTLFTAANPAMPCGGLLGESKSAILEVLARGGAPVARFRKIPADGDEQRRVALAMSLMGEASLDFPVVVKPDVGERGAGVVVARDEATLRRAISAIAGDAIVQEHVAGRELGVFYYRRPGQTRGCILSITDKRMPVVVGDGERTLERLILDDPRAVCMARTYLAAQAGHLDEVPAKGQAVQLVELGTHCRGALFFDGAELATTALEEAVDRMSRAYPGFYFGRYDIRGPLEAMRRGEGFRIVELNGVTSESTDIYDPRNGLLDAYRRLFGQWRLAFEIGARNRESGTRPCTLRELARLLRLRR